MFEKYIMIKDSKIIVGQNATTGAWYCKELPAESTAELDLLIGEVNGILNRRNRNTTKKKEKKETEPKVRM